jgi:hypothetical protein
MPRASLPRSRTVLAGVWVEMGPIQKSKYLLLYREGSLAQRTSTLYNSRLFSRHFHTQSRPPGIFYCRHIGLDQTARRTRVWMEPGGRCDGLRQPGDHTAEGPKQIPWASWLTGRCGIFVSHERTGAFQAILQGACKSWEAVMIAARSDRSGFSWCIAAVPSSNPQAPNRQAPRSFTSPRGACWSGSLISARGRYRSRRCDGASLLCRRHIRAGNGTDLGGGCRRFPSTALNILPTSVRNSTLRVSPLRRSACFKVFGLRMSVHSPAPACTSCRYPACQIQSSRPLPPRPG